MTETCLKYVLTIQRDNIADGLDRILFRTQDLSQVKEYCCRTWTRILENKVSIQDFIFAKEVKMGTYRLAIASSFSSIAIMSDDAVQRQGATPSGCYRRSPPDARGP